MTTGCVRMMEKKMKGDFQKLEENSDDSSAEWTPDEEEVLPLQMTHLTAALRHEARTKLNETDERKAEALAKLRLAVQAEKKLVCPDDDLFLLAFLRSRKYSVKKAFKLIQSYFRFRRENDHIYGELKVDEGIALLQRNFLGLLAHRDRNGCPVFVFKIGLWEPEQDSYENVFRVVTAVLVYSQEHEATQIAGFRGIIDFRGTTWKQLKYFTPSILLLVIRSTQFCYPARYKGVHILCENKAMNFLWGMSYPFLTPKLKKRIFFHGEDLKPLQQYIHPSVLPEEFGGEAPRFSNESMKDLIYSRVDVVLAHLNYGYKD